MAKRVSSSKNTAPKGVTTLEDRYDIHIDQPLTLLNGGPARCFAVTDKNDKERFLCAHICDPKLPPRHNIIKNLYRIDHRQFMRPITWGVVPWYPEKRRLPVVIFEGPMGKRVFENLKAEITPWTSEQIIEHFLSPISQILREFNSFSLTHRNIRPDNLFYTSEAMSDILVGECWTGPVSYAQNYIYETIEDSLASNLGRGAGKLENDIYAVGVTTVALLFGQSPGRDWDFETALKQKILYGSYSAFVPHNKVSLTMIEPLRGMLNDKTSDRWELEDLLLWIDGRRLSPIKQKLTTKATRAFLFADRQHATVYELANSLSKNWNEAKKPINDGSLDNWIRRSIGDDDLTELVGSAKIGIDLNNVELEDAKRENLQDRLIGRMIIAMHPTGPLRYKKISASMSGLGVFVGVHAKHSDVMREFVEMLESGLIPFWFASQKKTDFSFMQILKKIDRMRVIIQKPVPGSGLERVIYELNDDFPCLSPMFEDDYVANLAEILPAIERIVIGEGKNIKRLFDRHIAAFIAFHANDSTISNIIEGGDLTKPSIQGCLAQVLALSFLQEKYMNQKPMPRLCHEISHFLSPSLDRLHSKKTKQAIEKQLNEAAKSGLISDLLKLLDNKEIYKNDQKKFMEAIDEYAKSASDIMKIKQDIIERDQISFDIGGQFSTSLSIIIASISSLVILIF